MGRIYSSISVSFPVDPTLFPMKFSLALSFFCSMLVTGRGRFRARATYVIFVLVSPCLVVCNCEVLFLCKGWRYVCHIFHVIHLPHDNLYAKGLGEVYIMLGPNFSSVYVSITVLFIPFSVSVPHLLHFCLSFVLSFLAFHTQLCPIYHMWIWFILYMCDIYTCATFTP